MQPRCEESYSVEFLRNKGREERKPIQNNVSDDSFYNEAITAHEYKIALNSAKESAPGHERITYSLLQYLHPATKVIIELYSRIFQERSFPTTWKTSVVIPIPKPNRHLRPQ